MFDGVYGDQHDRLMILIVRLFDMTIIMMVMMIIMIMAYIQKTRDLGILSPPIFSIFRQILG